MQLLRIYVSYVALAALVLGCASNKSFEINGGPLKSDPSVSEYLSGYIELLTSKDKTRSSNFNLGYKGTPERHIWTIHFIYQGDVSLNTSYLELTLDGAQHRVELRGQPDVKDHSASGWQMITEASSFDLSPEIANQLRSAQRVSMSLVGKTKKHSKDLETDQIDNIHSFFTQVDALTMGG